MQEHTPLTLQVTSSPNLIALKYIWTIMNASSHNKPKMSDQLVSSNQS